MPKYRVYLETIASTTVTVEAGNKDEALDAAYERSMPTICAQCSGWGKGQNLELNDTWETPRGMTADEAIEEVED